MDWLLATPQIRSVFSSLGSMDADTYVINPNALAILEEINYKLTYEDQTLRTFRRAIGFGQNVRTDLIPLLENAKDENILNAVIRILVNLTVPVECLFSVDVMYRTEVGRHTIFELNKLLYTSKEAFTDPKSTKSVVEYMKHILESESKLTPQKCDQINNCLLLFRNVLHIPESNANFIMPTVHSQANGARPASMQNTILWNLFIQSIDKLLLYLMTCPQRGFWGVTMVQLIALMYKDQHVSTLQKLLNLWFEASLSDSSEDNESNTSPPKQGSGDSSPMLTSDPTSDSSDNGGCSKNGMAEDRRQALRDETVATLQEVSRKGQEYQISILRGPSDHGCAHPTSVPYSQGKESPTYCFGEPHNKSPESALGSDHIGTILPQPVEHMQNTTKYELMEEDSMSYMPPPLALPLKGSISLASSLPNEITINTAMSGSNTPPKTCVKVPHSGKLSLAKGKCCPQKRECPSSQSELSDCGYATQVENQESISTSSNDDDGPQKPPQHQKPPCNSKPRNKQRNVLSVVDKKELRRKKLVKRSKSSLINMKGLVQHTPTDEDISNILKEFTVDFLLKGYGHLVQDLHVQLLTSIKIPIDTSHFFWLVTYFLKFAAQLELDMEHINTILTYDIISYLTYEGVILCEQLELNIRQEGSDLKPYLRRMHLVVTAIREFLQAIETYKKVAHLNEDDRNHLNRLQVQISTTEELRCLFVLLLRRFNPGLHTKQYLQDLVVTNHILLLILDSVAQSEENIKNKMITHISQFANVEIMHHYGILLEDFNNNTEFVNDCIFTMMHHIGGDLDQIGCLFQPIILKTYSRIWEADYELSDDWSDLIEYVIHKFINTPQKSPLTLPTTSLTELTKEHNLETAVCTWTQEEMDTLYWYYVQSKKNNDVVGKIVILFSNNGNKHKSRISIIQQLLQQDIITLVEYDELMKFEDAEYQRNLLTTPTPSTTESGIDMKDHSSSQPYKPSDDIQTLLDLIIKENKQQHLIWLQQLLLECCYIKLVLKSSTCRDDHQNLEHIMEPVVYHCMMKNKSIPIVQWNNEQATTMLYQPFVLLMHKMGLQLPADAGSVFARIPDFWNAETMYSLAKKLGSLDHLTIKFDVDQIEYTLKMSAAETCRYSHPTRASFSSSSSLEVDEEIVRGRVGSLTPVPEVDIEMSNNNGGAGGETFAIPKAKHANSMIRFTPDPTAMPSVPNWLQLVMRSKCNPAKATTPSITASERSFAEICMSANSMMSTTMTNTSGQSSAAITTTISAMTNVTTTTILTNTMHGRIQQSAKRDLPKPCPTVSSAIGSKSYMERNNNNNCNHSPTITSTTQSTSSSSLLAKVNNHQQHHQYHHYQSQVIANHTNHQTVLDPDDGDAKMKSLETPSGLTCSVASVNRNHPHGGRQATVVDANGNLQNEYSAMVAAVYENEIANSDCASVASDLTRMYVSDEDEKPEFPASNFP